MQVLKKIHCVLLKERVYRIAFFAVCLICVSGYLISRYEGLTVGDGVWWSIVTSTTVGYGDISPKSLEGRIIAVVLMVCGISIICMLTGKIAEFMTVSRIRKMRGLSKRKLKNHIIICNWNGRAHGIIKEIKTLVPNKKIIVVDSKIDGTELLQEGAMFYKGGVDEETLRNVSIEFADTVIILGDSALDHKDRDAKCILDTLTVESTNPNVYSVVELVDERNKEYCYRAHADEVISSYTLGSNLISNAAVNHGMSDIVYDLLSNKGSAILSIVDCKYDERNANFSDVAVNMKKDYNCTLIGVIDGKNKSILNPDSNYQICSLVHKLIVIKNAKA